MLLLAVTITQPWNRRIRLEHDSDIAL